MADALTVATRYCLERSSAAESGCLRLQPLAGVLFLKELPEGGENANEESDSRFSTALNAKLAVQKAPKVLLLGS